MPKPRITIVGLGLIGSSIGLALSREQRDFEIVGHDKSNTAAGQAKKIGAVDKTEWNLISACDGAGLVILALPLGAIRATMQAVAGELAEGAIVIDTASVKAPVQAWADELLPASVAFVGTNPIVGNDPTGGATARVDLFERRLWAICPSPSTDERAVKTASDLAARLGASPLYLDATEHDGLTARKLAGAQFESSTRLVSSDPHVFSDAMLHSPEQVVRWIDGLIDNMAAWRDLIAAGDSETIDKAFVEAMQTRDRWLSDRSKGNWEDDGSAPIERPSILGSLLGLGRLTERRQRNKK